MNLQDCRRCGAFCVPDGHRCPPRYIVWSPDQGTTEEDGRAFYADSERAAAEAWAKWHDWHSADYTIVRGSAATVHVKREDGGEILAFTVTGEIVNRYTAHVSSLDS